jgi:hypothetical protein
VVRVVDRCEEFRFSQMFVCKRLNGALIVFVTGGSSSGSDGSGSDGRL